MATPKFNSKSPTIRRILREAQELSTSPSPDYTATPLETDLFEWHFTLKGAPDSVYAEGIYHGRIVLPPTYPLRPPSFRFLTPSGRFEANREICLSISGHHEETWQPAWGVRTALVALRSFMETNPKGQLGGLETTDSVRRRLAGESRSFRCAVCARTNAEIIAEAEAAAAAEAESSGGAARQEVEIPAELKMGWRDEMGKGDANAASDSETGELAEGFFQTTPTPVSGVHGSPPAAPAAPQHSAQSSATALLPQPTSTTAGVPAINPNRPQPAAAIVPTQRQQLRRQSDDGVPVWVDRAIVIVGAMLLAMFVKVIFV